MVKPIGNLQINLSSNDKVSHRMRAKFAPKSIADAVKQTASPPEPVKKPVKFKKRKR